MIEFLGIIFVAYMIAKGIVLVLDLISLIKNKSK
ncbi:hypothetical protein IEU_05590 [Bacillus mycoides]|nr:hypothetical protein IEU_05590 [Bacillus mycoides]